MNPPRLVDDLLNLAGAGSSALVVNRVIALLNDGWAADDVVTRVLAPMQTEAGRRWEYNALTVAEEHAVTAVVDTALEALSVLAPMPRVTGGRLAVVCAEGEWHVLPARMAAQRWRWLGWDVVFLGGSVPPADLGRWLELCRPDAIACSCSMPEHLPGLLGVAESAAALDVPVVAGGAGTGRDGGRCSMLGIRWAPDVAGCEDALARPAPVPDPGALFERRAEADDLLSEIEEVVDAALDVARDQEPAVRGLHALHRQQAVDDLRVVVRHLVAAVLIGDAEVFEEFIEWRRRVLTTRGVDAEVQQAVLPALAVVLSDFDRAARYVAAAAG